MQIRSFKESDYAALAELSSAVAPDQVWTAAILKRQDEDFDLGYLFERVLGEQDGQVIASGAYYQLPWDSAERYSFSFRVHPNHQEGPAPAHMQSYLLERLMALNPPILSSRVQEDVAYRVRLLEDVGFQVVQRNPISELDVTAFDFAPYADLQERLEQRGIHLVTLTDVMAQDPDWRVNVWRMFTQIEVDIPDPDEIEPTPFEQYARYYEGDDFRPDSWAIAVDTNLPGADRYVGMCVVNMMPTSPQKLFAGITGVVRSHRRRKIATALKVRSFAYALEHGYRFIRTDNEENNPMFDLNLKLGFKPMPGWLYFEKRLNTNRG